MFYSVVKTSQVSFIIFYTLFLLQLTLSAPILNIILHILSPPLIFQPCLIQSFESYTIALILHKRLTSSNHQVLLYHLCCLILSLNLISLSLLSLQVFLPFTLIFFLSLYLFILSVNLFICLIIISNSNLLVLLTDSVNTFSRALLLENIFR